MPTIRQKTSEKAFEEYIEKQLVSLHNYISRDSEKCDCELAMDTELVMEFLNDTQKEKIEKLTELHGDRMEEKLLKRIDEKISERGVFKILREGINHGPVHLDMMYFKPTTNLNPLSQELYSKNIFSVMRQVFFSLENRKSIDMALFINGLPIVTAELKNEMTGQTVWHAMKQYRTNRDKKEKLLSFKRCIAHFAVDTNEVFMATKLADEKTFFLPFNRGKDGGAGNPIREDGKHKTSYLWEDVWSRDSWSDLIKNFIAVIKEEKEDDQGRNYTVETQIFPRFHQRDAVLKLAGNISSAEPGKNYLIQHSAGSGKSMTIAWTAYRLANLHDENNEKLFDSVFVITDRRALDKQLRKTVQSFEPVQGFLYTVKEEDGAKTAQLTEAIEGSAKIITTTIHVFPYVADVISEFPGRRFAILIDEAHSSQNGETARAIQEVLHKDDANDEDFIIKQIESRQQGENINYFAFTATPKQETLEKFGERIGDGFKPFSLYSMRQAIEEGFILDVLQNYTTYRQYFKIIKDTEENPELPRKQALREIRRYIKQHPDTIAQKIKIIVEHFHLTVGPLIKGKAKAMIVTNSRENAVKYKMAIDEYLANNKYGYKSIVAFSGNLKLDEETHTEASMNGFPERQTIEEFKKPEYRFLIVANKHQTGFDEPLLCGMYVDKTLKDVNAVQTLSRLNRTRKDKDRVFVLDFVNTVDDIEESFRDYYTTTILSEGLEPNIISDAVQGIDDLYKIDENTLDEFAEYVSDKENNHGAIDIALRKVAEDINRMNKDDIEDLRIKISFYVKLYPYAESILGYQNQQYEKMYWFLKYLAKMLKKDARKLLNVEDFIDPENIKIIRKEKERTIKLGLEDGDVLDPAAVPDGQENEDEKETLDKIINDVNKEWGTEFGEEQVKTLERMTNELVDDEDLQKTVEANDKKDVVSIKFEGVFNDKLNDQFNVDKLLWEKISENADLRKFVQSKMLDHVFMKLRE